MVEELLIEKHQTLYHMAEGGMWPSIRRMGLLSTEALLDRLGAADDERYKLLSSHRSNMTEHRGVYIRDQKPMGPNLTACLKPAGITPGQWFKFLNRKVFFWATLDRLETFRKVYADRAQLIIEVPTVRLINAHRPEIALCHINSGAARMPNHYRCFQTFQPIELFSYSSKIKPAEVTVNYSVPDIEVLASKVYEVVDGALSTLYVN